MSDKRRARPPRVADPKELRKLHKSAVAAAKAVEERCLGQPEARGPRAQADAQLLERFKSEDYASTIIDAWTFMSECALTPEKEQQVIKAMLDARAHAEALRQRAADRKMIKRLLGLKEKARALHDYFLRRQEFHRRVEMLRSLQRLLDHEIEALSEEIRSVTRELKTSAGRRAFFMVELSEAMVDIFDKPLNRAVAALTDVALEWRGEPTTAVDVAQARRRDVKRRQNVYSEKKEGVE